MAKGKSIIPKRISPREITEQLGVLAEKLKQYECDFSHCPTEGCKFVFDGLRLSQEVEILQKQNAALLKENELLKKQLAVID